MGLDWRNRYARTLLVVDAVVVLWAMGGALILRFAGRIGSDLSSTAGEPYVLLTLFLSAVWWLLLGLSGSRDTTKLGYGTEEFKRVLASSFWLFGFIAVVSYSLQLDIARGYVALALPAGVASLIAVRLLIRSHLRNQRKAGLCSSSVVVIGGPAGTSHLERALRSQPMAGYRPLAAYLPGAKTWEAVSLPVIGTDSQAENIVAAIAKLKPDAVALSSGVPLPPQTIRELGWALADMRIKLIMAPALTDIAGPRIHTQPIAGLPLIHVSTPNLAASQRLLKRSLDLLGASVLLLALLPVMALVSLAIKLESTGPVFFQQTRVGASGKVFRMYKFRSMVVDAEQQLSSLLHQNQGNDVLFKLKADPRITRTGRFLRRYSLDELPQLLNVLEGSMSLVGPRPPLPNEVEKYERHVHRRLLVRPGLTGLWQVSGRSLLSWDDSVRLDLYYVENWSLTGDIAILLKTVRAVLSRHGAY